MSTFNAPVRQPWRCPDCKRYHAPHVDTCPAPSPPPLSGVAVIGVGGSGGSAGGASYQPAGDGK
jgi:hypothetical protein